MSKPPAPPEKEFDWDGYSLGQKSSSAISLRSDTDDPMSVPVLQIAGATEGPTLLVFAGIHGDEYEGIDTILRLYAEISPDHLIGRLIMVPVANPYAYRGATRTTPEDGVNLARAFPGNPQGTVTERLAHELHYRLIARADFLLDLHSGGTHYAVATLVGYFHDEKSEFGRRCRAAAEAFGVDLLWGHSRVAEGRSISSAQSLGVPWLYTEAFGGRRIRPEDSKSFYTGALRLLRHLGMSADPQLLNIEATERTRRTIYGDGNFDASAVSEVEGFYIPAVPLMSAVSCGDKIGGIYSMNGVELQEVRAHADGYLVMMVGTPTVRRGDPLYLLAALEPEA
ncbi:succinylglutamate desuccinylase/aspartoacylase family protein [Paenibacillus sp.]|uniref:succinylglutamate desuccinylase/aspartoacylase family protein n=1 Tax=Paenibacillus sp. TaxID=58172 RepID=UPI002811015C|nr:succinylglutamate desuccinylase/aspartoacylase family protein [Paenibacillus sp.]